MPLRMRPRMRPAFPRVGRQEPRRRTPVAHSPIEPLRGIISGIGGFFGRGRARETAETELRRNYDLWRRHPNPRFRAEADRFFRLLPRVMRREFGREYFSLLNPNVGRHIAAQLFRAGMTSERQAQDFFRFLKKRAGLPIKREELRDRVDALLKELYPAVFREQ